MILKSKLSYWTLFLPKYWAFIGENVIPTPRIRSRRKVICLNRRLNFIISSSIIFPTNFIGYIKYKEFDEEFQVSLFQTIINEPSFTIINGLGSDFPECFCGIWAYSLEKGARSLFPSSFFSFNLFQVYHIKSLCKYYANSPSPDPAVQEE